MMKTGGCACGAVRYEIFLVLTPVTFCHCSKCRRWHGHIGAYTAVDRPGFRLTEQRGEELAGQPIHGVRGITELSDNGARGICARGERDGGRVDFREHLHQERRSVGPPPVDRRLGDAGARRDRFDSGRRVSGFLKQFTRGVEDGPLRLGAAGAACRWTGRVRRAT